MRGAVIAAAFGLAGVAACSAPTPNPYPESTKSTFMSQCGMGLKPCACAWDAIIRAMTHDEYQAALQALETRGVMDPRIVQASLACRP